MLRKPMRAILLLAVAAPALFAASQAGYPDKIGPGAVTGPKVLTAPEAAKFLPDAVFFRGQSAPIRLEPGAYGCGFIAGNAFVVMDIGGHDLFSIRSSKDADLRRPTPLQVLPSPGGSGYRLYVGRDFVNFAQSATAAGSHHP